MNYNELQQIVRELKKKITCQECREHFINEDIEVVSTYQEQAVILINCYRCKTQIVVQVAIVGLSKKQGKQKLDIHQTDLPLQLSETDLENLRTYPSTKISVNEILDLHVFLNKFNGDFKALFKNLKKTK